MSLPPSQCRPVASRRAVLGWSQAELAVRASIPRTTISAIEGGRLTPSVTAALAVAGALGCTVEALFGCGTRETGPGPEWAWETAGDGIRYWEAVVGARRLRFPVEGLSMNAVPHDGVWNPGMEPAAGLDSGVGVPESTLVVACCDPGAGLLAAEYRRLSGHRMIVLQRGGGEALALLKDGLVHVAGLHVSTQERPGRNVETIRSRLGGGFRLLRVAEWQEGVALAAGDRAKSVRAAIRGVRRWALREPGSAARECLEELRQVHGPRGRTVRSHAAVAEAVRGGWADGGICVRVAAEDAGLRFLPVRTEMLDFCFRESAAGDARILALVSLLRSRAYRKLMGELPGYETAGTGEMTAA